MKPFLKNNGGYRNLRVFRMTEIICDISVFFINTYIAKGCRTRDQMEQAARSGKQNIAEGSKASMTSRETEIKLTNVAKASLEELQLDYEDFLRQHNLEIWPTTHPRINKMRTYLRSERFMNQPMEFVPKFTAEEICNLAITLIHQTTYMLRRLIESQQRQFLEEGGIREQMSRARIQHRKPEG